MGVSIWDVYSEPVAVSSDLTEMTVKELTMEYISTIKPRLKELSEANYRLKAEKHIIPAFGNMMCVMLP